MTPETQTKIVTEVEPEAVTEVVETQVPGLQGPQGEKGKTGTTFTPTVTKEGWVMWTNDGGAKNPSPVCIMGPQGDKGDQGERGEKGETGKLNADDLKAIQEAQSSAEVSAATATEQAGIATEKAEALTEAMDTLTTLSNDAVRFTSQEKTDAEKYQARKNIAASSASEVEALKKQVANLQAQAEGKTFTYETDATEAYSKDVPEGAYPYAAVKSFGGKTIVWNQLAKPVAPAINKGLPSLYKGSQTTVGENGRVTTTWDLEESQTASRFWLYYASNLGKIFELTAGHRYLFFTDVSTNIDIPGDLYISFNETFRTKAASNEKSSAILVASNSMDITGISFYNFESAVTVGNESKFSAVVMLFDITQMFGSGKEPGVEEFQKIFYKNYYEYNTGELKNVQVNNLNIVGANYIDFAKIVNPNACVFVDGVLSNKTTDTGATTFVQIQGTNSGGVIEILFSTKTLENGRHYYCPFTLKNNQRLKIKFNGAKLDIVFIASETLPGVYRSFVFSFDVISADPSVVGGVKIKNLMLTKGVAEKAYSPYKEENRAIPQAVLGLEGYGWSAGTAKNWVDWEKKEYHREVASVDLGECVWIETGAAGTGHERVCTYSLKDEIAKKDITGEVGNLICGSLVVVSANDTYTKSIDKSISVDGSGRLLAYDSVYCNSEKVDPSGFKDAVKGVLLYYELAEPEIIDISDILPDDNLLEVEEGGTITFENSNGGGFRIPVPSEIVYQKKVTTDE